MLMKKKFVIVVGGLGNQMFEYAFLLALRKRGYKAVLDTSYYDFLHMHNGYELDRIFGISEETINKQGFHVFFLRFLNKFAPPSFYLLDSLEYNALFLNNPPRFIKGYWQDERYFKDIEVTIREVFHFKDLDRVNLDLAKEMQNCNSVSVHIRRGDYSSFRMTLMGEGYYKRAIDYISNRIDSPVFYFFSDDEYIAKCIAEKMNAVCRFVTNNKKADSYKDMYLMSHCQHNIIANSSFSWWGAWLNRNNEKIVIAPATWDNKTPSFHPQLNEWVLL